VAAELRGQAADCALSTQERYSNESSVINKQVTTRKNTVTTLRFDVARIMPRMIAAAARN
jgi:hypothetical protein